MRIWIDLANSPHVPLMAVVTAHLRDDGHEVLVTARDHAQTVDLAESMFAQVEVIGGDSPGGIAAKGRAIGARAGHLYRFARDHAFDVALSHGSYAQLLAARPLRVRAVTMMDYEHQPANHLSFRLAQRVVVPGCFPETALRRFGARAGGVLKYRGFKEDLYLAGAHLDDPSVASLGIPSASICVVLRPPPSGALYHRAGETLFAQMVGAALENPGVHAVLLPRNRAQREAYRGPGIVIPDEPVHGPSLLARADVVVGGGGTMNREAALLGIPTYTVFTERLASVDAELIRLGRMYDIRSGGQPLFVTKPRPANSDASRERAKEIMGVIRRALRA